MVEAVFSIVVLVAGIAFLVHAASRYQESKQILDDARRASAEAKERATIVIDNFFQDRPLPEASERRIVTTMMLPPDMIDTNRIDHLPIGATAYTVPWAMMVDEDMRMWVNGSYTVHDRPGGTVQMHLRRVDGGVEIISGMEKQRPTRGIPWVGSTPSDLLPVLSVPRHAISR